ncbi:putative reverse transcriptase domain-containing protein [Tanacetum coccineum]
MIYRYTRYCRGVPDPKIRIYAVDFVLSDSEDSTVTYTEVNSPFEDLSDIGSPGVDGLPMMPEDPYAYVEAALQAPPSLDYVPGPEEPEHAPTLPDFVPESVYPEFMPSEDDVLPDEEQLLRAAVSLTADSPGYIIDSDPEEDLEEDDKDPEEDPADYPSDRDDEEENSFGDDVDDEEEDEDEDEEEHPALADSSTTEVDRFLAISTLPPSPLTSYSSPLPHISSPPLPVSSPLPVSPPPLPASPTYPLGYIAAMIRAFMAMMRADAPSTYILASRSETPPSGTSLLLPIPLPTPSPPLLLPSTDCRAGVSEATLPPRKRLCITLGLRFKVGESSSAPTPRPTGEFRRDYGFVATLDDEIRRDLERDVGYGITYTWDEMVEDISLMSGQLNLLRRDRCAHARTTRLMEGEARLSRKAWVQSMDASDTAHYEVRALRTMTQMAMLQSQQTPTRDPAHLDVPEEAGRVADVLAEREATISGNGEDSHDSGMGGRRQAPLAHDDLTWWNSHVKTVGYDVAYAMTWKNLKKKMTDKYCLRGEVEKLEGEMWNLKFKGTDMVGYNQQFQELALMYARMFPEESNKIEKYVDGLPDMIHESVMASKPKTMQDAIEFATELMDKKIHTFLKRQRSSKKKPYGGSKPLYSKCNYHHDSQCDPKCHKYNRVGHLARDCRSTINSNTADSQNGTGAGPYTPSTVIIPVVHATDNSPVVPE